MKTKFTFTETIFKVIIFTGIVLSIINFLDVRSLWADEAKLALNIVNRPLSHLLTPLEDNQVAPIGFLVLERCFAYLFNNTDWSLRIVPLLSFFVSIYLLYKVAFTATRAKLMSLFSTAFFSTTYNLLYYSSEVKQYSLDVTICLAIILITLIFLKTEKRFWLIIYGLSGVVSIWFSNVSVILLFSSGAHITYSYFKKNKAVLRLLIPFLSWAISFVIYFLLFIHKHPTKEAMLIHWSEANAFLPQNIFSIEFYKAVFSKGIMLLNLFGTHVLNYIIAALFIIGIVSLWRKRKAALALFLLPIVVHLILAYFKLYPFKLRLILYLYPIALILCTIGLNSLFNKLKAKHKKLSYICLIIALLLNIYSIYKRGFPIEKEEIKQSLTYLNQNISRGDNLYIYPSANTAFTFYKNEYSEISKIEDITIGNHNRDNWKKYEDDIKNIKSPTWLLFSHVYKESNRDQESYLINLLKKNNFNIIKQENYKGSSIYKVVLESTEQAP